MTTEVTPEELGARLFKEGAGLSHFWNDAPDTSKETLNRMLVGYEIELKKAMNEPYAYIYETDSPFGLQQSLRYQTYNGRMPDRTVPVYTTPQQRKPLTDEDVYQLANEHLHYQTEGYEVSGIYSLARAIEAAHGIKGEA